VLSRAFRSAHFYVVDSCLTQVTVKRTVSFSSVQQRFEHAERSSPPKRVSPVIGMFWSSSLLCEPFGVRGVPTLALAFSVFPARISKVVPSFSDLFKGVRAALQWLLKTTANRTLQREIKITGDGWTRSFAYLSVKNPVGHPIRILSVKIRFAKTKVVCACIHKDNSKPDERLGTCPILLDAHSTAKWEIPYQVIGAGKEPDEIILEYETLRKIIKEKSQDPTRLRFAIKEVQIPDSAKNCIRDDFEGSLIFDDRENFPAAMGSARKSFFENTNFCESLHGSGVTILNETNRLIEIESVWFVRANERTRAYLNEDYIKKGLAAARTLRSKEKDLWIIPKVAYPLWQGCRHVEITYRMSIGEESYVDTIEKLL
jgi:hypothetical protein